MGLRKTKRQSIRTRVLAECSYKCERCGAKEGMPKPGGKPDEVHRLNVVGALDRRAWHVLCSACCGKAGNQIKQSIAEDRDKQLSLSDAIKVEE